MNVGMFPAVADLGAGVRGVHGPPPSVGRQSAFSRIHA